MRTRLEHDAEAVLALVSVVKGQAVVDLKAAEPVFQQPYSGHYFLVSASGQSWRSRSLWDFNMQWQAPGESTSQIFGPRQQPLLIFERSYQKQGMHWRVLVAEDLTHLQQDLQRFRLRYALLSLVVLGLIIGFQIIVVRRALLPLQLTRAQLTELERGGRDTLSTEVPVEIRPLVMQINRLLEIMQGRLQRSRNALGNLAHGIKTPLAALMQSVRQPELERYPDLQDDLLDKALRVQKITEKELHRARMAGGGTLGQAVDIISAVQDLFSLLASVYRDKNLDFQLQGPHDLPVNADRDDMLELLGVLLDNASKWAKGVVRVSVVTAPKVVLVIEDDGPGVDEEKLAQLVQRGSRMDEQVEGFGLGLAIAKDIVDSYGGELHLCRSGTLSGLRVELELPWVLKG